MLGKSNNSAKDSLLIEQYTGFYLDHVQHCWDIVYARDTTIDNLRQQVKLQGIAISASQTQVRIANRLTASYLDSVENLNSVLSTQKIATEKERKRKKNWRKVTIFESLIILGIGFITYTTVVL